MKKTALFMFGLMLLFGSASHSAAQVKRVQMHIAGYLCGNGVYNIQKAVSRLDYAPKLKEIEVTNIKKGLAEFTPKPDKPVSFAALKATLKTAGYVLDAADIVVTGTLEREGDLWVVTVKPSGQKFVLQGPNVTFAVSGNEPGSPIEIIGNWKTVRKGTRVRR